MSRAETTSTDPNSTDPNKAEMTSAETSHAPVGTVADDRTDATAVAVGPPTWTRALSSPGWIPAIVVAAATAVVLRFYAVPAQDVAMFALYSLGCVTLPGVLIWRAVYGRAGYLAFDLAFGTTIGFVVELPVYMLARELGVPLAVLIWPIATVIVFAAVPGLRRHWLGGDARLPLGTAWSIAGSALFVLASIAVSVFRWNALSEPASSTTNVDFPFQIALVGEFKHDVPLNTPWVTGTPLLYHWYVYAHGAAASWITGAEPQIIIMRLLPTTMIAAFLIVLVAIVHRLTGRWWPGNVALLLTLMGVAASPFAWHNRPTFNGIIIDNLWISPTQTFAALFCAATLYVLFGIFRASGPDRRRRGPWITFTLLVAALAGAKATFLPMLVCGLALALLIRLIVTRRAGPELPALGITLVWLLFAQFVLYGGGSQGTEIMPLQTIKWTPLGEAVMGRAMPPNHWKPILVLTALGIIGTAFGWAGMIGLLRRAWRLDPAIHVLVGFAGAGVGGLYVFAHPGLSQTYFARSATPYLAILSAIGLAALIPAGKRALRGTAARKATAVILGAVALGAASLLVVQFTKGEAGPSPARGGWNLREATFPYLLLVGLVAVAVVVIAVAGRRLRLGRNVTLAAMCVTVLATAVTSGVMGSKNIWIAATAGEPIRNLTAEGTPRTIPAGAIEASRWLRDHSDPLDIVATNSHCRAVYSSGCDSRDFWLAAYTERQVLVEGWSYTEKAFASGGLWDGTLVRSKFWNPALLAANDAVFYTPTAERVTEFVTTNKVRWLVAVGSAANPDLGRYTTLRYQVGDIKVYEVTGA